MTNKSSAFMMMHLDMDFPLGKWRSIRNCGKKWKYKRQVSKSKWSKEAGELEIADPLINF